MRNTNFLIITELVRNEHFVYCTIPILLLLLLTLSNEWEESYNNLIRPIRTSYIALLEKDYK